MANIRRRPGTGEVVARRTLTQRLAEYDRHNPFCRFSDDPALRMYGKCGCRDCAATRKEWALLPAPIDRQNRDGSSKMAGINVCDRCNALVKGIALGAIQIRTSADYDTQETVALELCPACIAQALALLESAVTEPRDKAYTEPFKRPPAQTDKPLDLDGLIQEAVNRHMRQIEG